MQYRFSNQNCDGIAKKSKTCELSFPLKIAYNIETNNKKIQVNSKCGGCSEALRNGRSKTG